MYLPWKECDAMLIQICKSYIFMTDEPTYERRVLYIHSDRCKLNTIDALALNGRFSYVISHAWKLNTPDALALDGRLSLGTTGPSVCRVDCVAIAWAITKCSKNATIERSATRTINAGLRKQAKIALNFFLDRLNCACFIQKASDC